MLVYQRVKPWICVIFAKNSIDSPVMVEKLDTTITGSGHKPRFYHGENTQVEEISDSPSHDYPCVFFMGLIAISMFFSWYGVFMV